MAFGEKLLKFLCPYTIDPCENREEAQEKYGDYQQFLNTLITIGTLLMGFILTGTLLNYTYTGEIRRKKFAEDFDIVSLWACAFATGSVMASLLVSVRGSIAFRNNGPVKALRAMRNSTIWMGFAELAIYLSIYYFSQSVFKYLHWAQKGPTGICEDMKGPVSECSQLTEDFGEAAERLCATWNQAGFAQKTTPTCDYECLAINRVCDAMQPRRPNSKLKVRDKTFPKVPFLLWGNFYRQEALIMINSLGDEMCRRPLMHRIVGHLCEEVSLSGIEAQEACTIANGNFIKADECAQNAVDTMALCNNVCKELKGLEALLASWRIPSNWIFTFIVAFRCFKIAQQLVAVCRYHATTANPAIALLREVGVCDDFDSDEEFLENIESASEGEISYREIRHGHQKAGTYLEE